jgi:stage IV sporulation protein FB
VIFHELGHFLAIKIYNYQDLGIFFIPLLGAYASGTKKEVSQKQSAVILLAGPLPGIIVGIILYFVTASYDMPLPHYTVGFLIFLNLLNLLPIYPLDGGQLLNRLFLDDTKIIGKIFVVLSVAALSYFVIKLAMLNPVFYVMLVFPAMMLLRLRSDAQHDQLIKRIETSGINLEKTYDELTDEEYWQIRNMLIEHDYPMVRNIKPAPPYEYSPNESKVVSAIENLLQRSIIQDLGWAGKLFIILLWAGCFAVPFILDIDLPFTFRR